MTCPHCASIFYRTEVIVNMSLGEEKCPDCYTVLPPLEGKVNAE